MFKNQLEKWVQAWLVPTILVVKILKLLHVIKVNIGVVSNGVIGSDLGDETNISNIRFRFVADSTRR